MTKKLSFFLYFTLIGTLLSVAQIINPVSWEKSLKMTGEKTGEVIFTATIDNGWHIYGLNLPKDSGVQPTEIEWTTLEGVELAGELTPSRIAHEEIDIVMNMKLSWWENDISLIQKFNITDNNYNIAGNIKFMACNNETCQRPTEIPFEFTSGNNATNKEKKNDIPSALVKTTETKISGDKLWEPVEFIDNTETKNEASIEGMSSWLIFIGGFAGGLLALLTPCVWPMIPLTVSFFLKKSGSRRKSILNAILYGLSIIVIYLILGLAVTIIFGASALNALSTNAIFNIIFFLMLIIFAISFFGAFEIKLPDSWANKMDRNAEKTTGLLSIFFMAFTP